MWLFTEEVDGSSGRLTPNVRTQFLVGTASPLFPVANRNFNVNATVVVSTPFFVSVYTYFLYTYIGLG